MKICTRELIGNNLDLMVTRCEGGEAQTVGQLTDNEYYSTRWVLGGPIIERERIEIGSYADQWQATMYLEDGSIFELGLTPLIAAMRCYVASKLGNEVEIQEELK